MNINTTETSTKYQAPRYSNRIKMGTYGRDLKFLNSHVLLPRRKVRNHQQIEGVRKFSPARELGAGRERVGEVAAPRKFRRSGVRVEIRVKNL